MALDHQRRFAKLALGVLVCALARVQAAPPLAQRHKEFLNGPPSLLLTKAERLAFQKLTTDESRDKFIERFWEVRNPTPGLPENPFKEEFYRRVAYANSFYGKDAGSEGWRTDRGRTYILFGKPQTSMNFSGNQELYPTELWFYSNPGLTELPAFFYVLFFERDGVSGYRLYNPYTDGPDKLLRTGPTKAQAYQYLRNLNSELARATLSLIPGEPVDTENFNGSMESTQVINAIRSYSEQPSYVSAITSRTLRMEQVSSRIEYDMGRATMAAFAVQSGNDLWLHWVAEVRDPRRFQVVDGKVSYQIRAQLYSHGQLVYERDDSPEFSAPAGAVEQLNRRPFRYEGRLPVTEGAYRLVVTIRHPGTGAVYETYTDINVERPADRTALSEILIVEKFEPDQRRRPFQFAGMKIQASPSRQVFSSRGLRVCYQIRLPEPKPAKLKAEYIIANPSTRFRKSFEEDLDLKNADANGALLTSKTLAIEELTPGTYQLALRITDPSTGRISARSAAFSVVASTDDLQPVIVSQSISESSEALAANHYQRALCFLSQGKKSEAVQALEAAWSLTRNPVVRGALDHLNSLASRQEGQNLPRSFESTPSNLKKERTP